MQSLLAQAAARVEGGSDGGRSQTSANPVQPWIEKVVTQNSTARVSQDDLSALKVWAHTHGWDFVEQIVSDVSLGNIDYLALNRSMAHLKPAHKTAILLSLQKHPLPENFYESTRDSVMQRGGNQVDALYKLAQVTVARLWFLDAWTGQVCSSFFSEFLAPWLSLVDVVKMDSAVPRASRQAWLGDLRTLKTEGIDSHPHTPRSIEWVRRNCRHITRLHTRESARPEIKDTVFGDLSGVPPVPPNPDGTPGPSVLFPDLRLVELGDVNCTHCQITTAGVTSLVRGCPKLESLNLMHCDVTDNGLRTIARHCPLLTLVALKSCSKITDAGVLALAQGAPLICNLDVSWCNKLTDVALKFVGVHLPLLHTLDLSLCTLMTDVGIKAMVRGTPLLRHLSLYACKLISDAAVKAIAQSCMMLQTLKLALCEKVTNEGVTNIGRGCSNLRHLNLSLCEKITDAGIFEVTMRCRKLQIINCYGDKLLTDNALKHMADHCPDIHTLNLYRCELIGDDGLLHMARLARLQHVNLWNVPRITTAGFKAVIAACQELESIDVRNCELVSPEALHEAKRLRPDLDLEGGER